MTPQGWHPHRFERVQVIAIGEDRASLAAAVLGCDYRELQDDDIDGSRPVALVTGTDATGALVTRMLGDETHTELSYVGDFATCYGALGADR
jgi:hypothetical protein